MTQFDFDVIVVGAGPGGNAAAYRLACEGFSVALIEKCHLPRDKTCGGGLPPKAISLIPYDVSNVIHRTINGAWLGFREDGAFMRDLQGVGYTVERAEFDYFMSLAAERAGVTLIQDSPVDEVRTHGAALGVEVMTRGRLLRSRVVVAADGVNSKVRSCVLPGSKPSLGWALESLLWFDDDRLSDWGDNCLFDFGSIPNGYGWIFPKRDHFNIGVYKFKSTPNNIDLRAYLNAFIECHPILQGASRAETKGYPIPLAELTPSLSVNNTLFVGDAGGLGESFYGEGITFALWSAKLAAEATTAYLKFGAPLAQYDSLLQPVRRELSSSRLIARGFHANPRAGFHFLVRNRYVNKLFANLITGRMTYTGCLWRTLLFFPLWAFAGRYKLDQNYPSRFRR